MLEAVIGLEIHIQLKTKTKMFCGCKTHTTAVAPNTNICPICLGHPGTLPVPNKEAIKAGVLIGLALNCKIAPHSKFDRKNYFYPDLPKAYQISQFDLPIAEKGFLEIKVPASERENIKIEINRAHLEEDAAKNIHDKSGKTFVDFNRGGTPLIEIVSEPDFRSAREAKIFLQELRLIARYLGVSNADMEKGQLRCDANVSLRPLDKNGGIVGEPLNPKTEVKNLNSFKHVEKAIEHEIKRQTKLWEDGTPPTVCTTRGWNDAKGITEDQRSKEEAADYKFFPEPDIPQMDLSDIADEMKQHLPELPAKKRARFEEEYSLKPSDAKQICDNIFLANFTEQVFSELHAWINSLPDFDEATTEAEKKKLGKVTAGWLLSKLGGILSERSIDIRIMKITPENFAEFITLIATKKLNNNTGLQVLNAMLDDGSDPSHIMEDKQLGQMEDTGVLAEIIDNVIDSHPSEVERFKAGEEKLMAFFIGMVMKESEGTADPGISKNMLKVKLNS
jgi:aspartyl-tRNA(Asn)/glutamyl-tRNA(Gln) amidotransferase subunit B